MLVQKRGMFEQELDKEVKVGLKEIMLPATIFPPSRILPTKKFSSRIPPTLCETFESICSFHPLNHFTTETIPLTATIFPPFCILHLANSKLDPRNYVFFSFLETFHNKITINNYLCRHVASLRLKLAQNTYMLTKLSS